jgi:hypothetical protein
VIAGTVKSTYDLVLWRWFRNVPLPQPDIDTESKEVPV